MRSPLLSKSKKLNNWLWKAYTWVFAIYFFLHSGFWFLLFLNVSRLKYAKKIPKPGMEKKAL